MTYRGSHSSQGRSWYNNNNRGWRGGRGRGRGGGYNVNRGRGYRGRGAGEMMPDPQPGQNFPRRRQTTLMEVPSPYMGWKLYFPDEMYSDHSPVVVRVQAFEKYILSWRPLFNLNDIEIKMFFLLDYNELKKDQALRASIPELALELKDSPDRLIAAMGLAMHQVILSARNTEMSQDSELPGGSNPQVFTSTPLPRIHARVINYDRIVPLKHLKANYYGKFVSVKGTVVRVSNVKPLCTKLAFECNSCGSEQSIALPDGKYTMPTACPNTECRGRTFNPKRGSKLTETIDWQTIRPVCHTERSLINHHFLLAPDSVQFLYRVQEIMGDDQKEAGRIPRTVDCELTDDQVDSCVPGDVVVVSGGVKVNNTDEGRSRNKDKCMFLLYIQGNSVMNTKGNKKSTESQNSGVAMEFSMKDLYAVEEIHSEKNLFRLLVGSLCPSIYGHEIVKAGLLLGLLGGTQKFVNDRNRIPVRGDPHILVVGDPGLGKSQMLQAVSNIAPRSVYVCGNTTTTSGLTVTLSKDGGSGDYALEAGALVLSDQGCCCIDEFDKMSNQHQALLEAMEQQSISIAKAGIVCSLPARTSIIAAANPVGGHYNKAKTVSENLRMGSALLSRFDLVFILLDKPDEEMDNILSDHVMALHAGKRSMTIATASRRSTENTSMEEKQDRSLSERLKLSWTESSSFDPIPHQLLRKYVGYARKYVHPKIGKEAAKVLQEFYLRLRKQHSSDTTPITTRQLESLIRLTEARARLELREEATKQDAADVIEIMKFSMRDTFSDEFGWMDFQRSQHGSGMSGRTQPKKFVSALQRISDQTYNSIFTVEQMKQIAKDMALRVTDFEGLIMSLNNQGYLLKKGPKVYQLQTAGY